MTYELHDGYGGMDPARVEAMDRIEAGVAALRSLADTGYGAGADGTILGITVCRADEPADQVEVHAEIDGRGRLVRERPDMLRDMPDGGQVGRASNVESLVWSLFLDGAA